MGEPTALRVADDLGTTGEELRILRDRHANEAANEEMQVLRARTEARREATG